MSILKLKDSQGNWIGVPTIKGDKGDGISSAVLNNDYTLTLTFTDGTTYTTPSIRGEKGEQGEPATDMDIHICSTSEYDSETRIPTITNPDDKTFYLVPTEDGTSPDLFTEWVYVNNTWEIFGSVAIDLSNYLTDVQINGVSIVTDGVAEMPIATYENVGVLKPDNYSLGIKNDKLSIKDRPLIYYKKADAATAVVCSSQHISTFYGLAKAAGDTTQSQSSNAVGTYTDEAKSAISDMLNGAILVEGTTPTITALSGVRYICGEVATLDFTPCATGICDVVFTSGNAPTVVTLPNTVKFPDGSFVAEADTTYEINILDGVYGAVMAWT